MKCPRCGKDNPPSIHTCTAPPAIYLAEQIEAVYEAPLLPRKAAAELRKQYEENAQLREQNTMLDRIATEYEDTVSQQAKRIAADEALLKQALETLELLLGDDSDYVILVAALRERLKS
jgi:hypothetical protein